MIMIVLLFTVLCQITLIETVIKIDAECLLLVSTNDKLYYHVFFSHSDNV